MNQTKVFNGSRFLELISTLGLCSLLQKLAEENSCQIWLVGGLVRDFIAGSKPIMIDFDLIVSPGSSSPEISQKIATHLGCHYFVLDTDRGTYRISQPSFQIDINAIRGKELLDDLFLRDFSMNAICISIDDIVTALANHQTMIPFLDYFSGTMDLQKKLIRAHNPTCFRDDPLRILRAFRFTGRSYSIDEQTFEQMIQDRTLLKNISPERIRDELCHILASYDSFPCILSMDKTGILEVFFPFLPLFHAIDQSYTSKLQVKNHTLCTLQYLEQILKRISEGDFPFFDLLNQELSSSITANRPIRVLLKIACLLHDIGKPSTLTQDMDRLRFFDHELVGASMATEWLEEMKFSSQEIGWISTIIQSHMRPHNLSNAEKLTPRAQYRFFREQGIISCPLLLLALADAYATKMVPMGELREYENFINDMLTFYSIPQQVKPCPLINGHEVMDLLKLSPSRLIGSLLEEILELQSLGQICTKEQAFAYLKNKKL